MNKEERLQYNRNGIPIDRYERLDLLQVMGVEDPFEGVKFDPQFDLMPVRQRGEKVKA